MQIKARLAAPDDPVTMADFRIDRLTQGDIDSVLVLARLGYECLTQDQWREMASRVLANAPGQGGVLLARDASGRARGLVVFSICPKTSGRPSLQVERVVAFDLMDPNRIAQALMQAVLEQAEVSDCDSLSLVRPLSAPASDAAMILSSGVTVLHQVL